MTPADKDRNVAALMAELRDASIEAGQLDEQHQHHCEQIRNLHQKLDRLEYHATTDRIVTAGHAQEEMGWPDEPTVRETLKERAQAREKIAAIKERLGELGFGPVLR